MTRYRIFSFITLVVALILASHGTVVRAHDVCDVMTGRWCEPVATDASGSPARTTDGVTYYAALTNQSSAADLQSICTDAPDRGPMCYTLQGDGSWAVEVLHADGQWVRTGTQSHPPTPTYL